MNDLLQSGLASLFGADAVVVERCRNDYTSTGPSEIVTVRFLDGRQARFLCKYPAGPHHTAFGHRGGPGYEALVYREVVSRCGLSAPAFVGEMTDGNAALVIEFVEGAVCADEAVPISDAMATAAGWAGRFHAANENTSPPLNRYDAAYYGLWPRRTAQLAARWHGQLPWLGTLYLRAEEHLAALVNEPTTVIHGEFTPHNVLVRAGTAYPVDWESAAIAIGEIDLACLTDKWPLDIAERCEREYSSARWPGGAPEGFARRLDLARLYWDFRWLGDRPEWTGSEKVAPRFEHLRTVAEKLEIL